MQVVHSFSRVKLKCTALVGKTNNWMRKFEVVVDLV